MYKIIPKCLTCGCETNKTINILLDRRRISSNKPHPLCEDCREKWIYIGEAAFLKIGRHLFYDVNYLLVFPYANGHCMEPVIDPQHIKKLSTRVTDYKIQLISEKISFDELRHHGDIK